MSLRPLKPTVLVLLLSLTAYLCVVAMWASATADAVLMAVPAAARAPLSLQQMNVLLRIEDPSFFAHPGISVANGQGFATITSAVARDVYLSGTDLDGVEGRFQALYRAVFACCRKIDLGRDVMALVLDRRLSKDRQLAWYISHVYMGTSRGEQVYGLPRAAESYFGKPLPGLTDHEFVELVAMIKAPNQYHPVKNKAAHALRTARIEALLSGRCQPRGWFDTTYDECR